MVVKLKLTKLLIEFYRNFDLLITSLSLPANLVLCETRLDFRKLNGKACMNFATKMALMRVDFFFLNPDIAYKTKHEFGF